VGVCAIRGNFDDAQTGVKALFTDEEVIGALEKNGMRFSSANSINWGRLVPQIVYYISAYCDLVAQNKIQNGDPINVVVPTGNFGNILAAYIAKLMGLPIDRLICASNKNNILTDFFNTGVYDRNRAFHLTMSPSMDILISSNLERLLYFMAGTERTAAYMDSLNKTGAYKVEDEVKAAIDESFCGFFADEQETAKTIREVMDQYGYLADTHTAVALSAAKQYVEKTGDKKPMIVASTASPYKFAIDVYRSLYHAEPADALSALDELSAKTGTSIPYPLCGIGERSVRFTDVVPSADMWKAVQKYLG
jgi:threonine synthase